MTTTDLLTDQLTQIKKCVRAALAECEQAERHDDGSTRLFARLQRGRWEEVEQGLRLMEREAEAV